MNSILKSKWTKAVVFLVCLVPAGLLIWDAFTGNLSSNPTQFLEHATGDWTLRFVALTLCITPFRKIFNQPQLIRFRKMLGLFAFFYGCCHLAIYLTFDQVFDLHGIWADIMKRRYITVGFFGFVLMIPLAITSTAGMIRRMGNRKWTILHRAIYATAIAGVIHFYWLVKSDVHLPLEYAAVMAALLGWRIYDHYTKAPRPVAASSAAAKQRATVASE